MSPPYAESMNNEGKPAPVSLLRSGQSQTEVSIPLSKITRRAASWEPQTISLLKKTVRKHKKVHIFPPMFSTEQ